MSAAVDELGIVHSALGRVRIFPLPSSVLIPGGSLPLHVFEPRYRQLVADVLRTDRVVGIPLLHPGWEADYDRRPDLFTIMGVGIVRAADRLPDGRYNILVQGVLRARILEELPSELPYRIVRAEPLEDRLEPGGEARRLGQGQVLRQLAVELATALPDHAGPAFARACLREQDLGRLADLAASSVLIETRERQEFLEEGRVEERLRIASDGVARILLQVTGGGGGLPI